MCLRLYSSRCVVLPLSSLRGYLFDFWLFLPSRVFVSPFFSVCRSPSFVFMWQVLLVSLRLFSSCFFRFSLSLSLFFFHFSLSLSLFLSFFHYPFLSFFHSISVMLYFFLPHDTSQGVWVFPFGFCLLVCHFYFFTFSSHFSTIVSVSLPFPSPFLDPFQLFFIPFLRFPLSLRLFSCIFRLPFLTRSNSLYPFPSIFLLRFACFLAVSISLFSKPFLRFPPTFCLFTCLFHLPFLDPLPSNCPFLQHIHVSLLSSLS